MRRRSLFTVAAILGASLLAGGAAVAAKGPTGLQNFHASLKGYEEVPVVSTPATGFLTIRINQNAGTIDYELNYENLSGSVTQSHIHAGQMGVAGGVSLWLCQTAASPAPAAVAAITPVCPTSGVVTGTLTAANVVGPAPQLIVAGDFDEIVAAIRAGVAYGNVHSSAVPGGEIRGQLR